MIRAEVYDGVAVITTAHVQEALGLGSQTYSCEIMRKHNILRRGQRGKRILFDYEDACEKIARLRRTIHPPTELALVKDEGRALAKRIVEKENGKTAVLRLGDVEIRIPVEKLKTWIFGPSE